MSKTETEYEIEAKEYISHLEPDTQKLAIQAIEDCLTLNRSWRWICTALNKKGYSNWNRWHFGLFFNNNFNASVLETMKREDEAEEKNLDEFFSIIEDKQQYIFPRDEVIESDNDEVENLPVFYHEPHGMNPPHYEEYEPYKFKYYEQILAGKALELNIPAIKYGLDHNDIDSEYIDIYINALEEYAGDIND